MVSNITCSKLNNHHNKKHTDAEFILKNPQNYSMVYKYKKKQEIVKTPQMQMSNSQIQISNGRLQISNYFYGLSNDR